MPAQKLMSGFLLDSLVGLPLFANPNTLAPPKSAVQKLFQSIKIFPSEIVLGNRSSSQRIVVQGFYPDGYSEDITAKANVSVGDAKTAQVASGVITPLAAWVRRSTR